MLKLQKQQYYCLNSIFCRYLKLIDALLIHVEYTATGCQSKTNMKNILITISHIRVHTLYVLFNSQRESTHTNKKVFLANKNL
jgi:hypothetical protein